MNTVTLSPSALQSIITGAVQKALDSQNTATHKQSTSLPALKSKGKKGKKKAAAISFDNHSRAVGDSTGDPNKIQINVTEGYIRNRLTLPREIYVKSNRDEYNYDDNEIMDTARAYVYVDGEKFPQSVNQGRSNKIQATFFAEDIEEGDLIVLKREGGNKWVSVVKSGAGTVAKRRPTPQPAKSKVSGNKSKAKRSSGRSDDSSKSKQRTGPKVSKGKSSSSRINLFGDDETTTTRKAKSKGQATQTANWPQVLKETAKTVIKNNKAGVYNDAIDRARKSDKDYRVFLKTAENRKFKQAASDAGLTLSAAVVKLYKAVKKLGQR